MNTNTPRTDAISDARGMFQCSCSQDFKDLSRQLERELAAHKTELTMWRDGEIKLANHSDEIDELEAEVGRLREALELIAAPRRPDGTYNRCREACETLAREALNPTEK